MRTAVFSLAVAALLAAASCPSVLAQRQTAGRHSVEAHCSAVPDASGDIVLGGAGALWSNQGYSGRVVWGIDACSVPLTLVEPETLDGEGNLIAPEVSHDLRAVEILALGGYSQRIWAPRSRALILSAGIMGGAGVRHSRDIGDYVKVSDSHSGAVSYARTGILVTVLPEVQAEVFLFRNVSLYASFRPRVTVFTGLGGKVDWFIPSALAGLKLYL